MEFATFGAGCFWGVERAFQKIHGVVSTKVGYTGGHKERPTYKEVCQGDTGHVEAVQVEFDPSEISYEKLLEIFWKIHNPTLVNKQGLDIGSQYSSAIFYHNELQKNAAEKSLELEQKKYKKKIATKIEPLKKFYLAEKYHQRYLDKKGL